MFQEAISTASSSGLLQPLIPNAVAYLSNLIKDEQSRWEGFEQWNHTMMDFAVFGSEENPIVEE
jgi:hypothetical protein